MSEIETYTDETLKERELKWEKEKKGILNDLQAERDKRQMFEERLNQLETSINTDPEDGGTPEQKVNRLAQDPDGYMSEIISQALEPVVKRLNSFEVERKVERAKKWIAKKEGIDPEDVETKYGNDLVRIGKERGFTSLDPEEGIKSSYEIMMQEKKDKEIKEKERESSIEDQSTESVRSNVTKTSGRLTRDMISRMSAEEYNSRREEILKADKAGLIKS